MFTYILDFLLVALALGMLLKGHYGVTRQTAFAPLVVAVLDASSAHLVEASLTPVLSALLVVLQIVILAGCGVILYRDRTLARNKQARRQCRREATRQRAAFEQAAERETARRPVARVA